MKKLLVVFTAFFFSLVMMAQELNKVITITPALLTYGTIAVQPGYQFKIDQRHSLLTELALPVSKKTPYGIESFNTFRISTELKYYPKKAIEGRFLGMQLGYVYRKLTDADSGQYWNEPNAKTVNGYSSAKISAPVFFFNLKLGREITHWDKLYMEYFLSMGIRVIRTRFDAEDEYKIGTQYGPARSCTPMFDWDPAWQDARNYLRPGASMGIRIGWKY